MREYQRVKVINTNYLNDGINEGAVGYIVHIYNDSYCEVEFSKPDGETYALQSIRSTDIIEYDENDNALK